MSAGNMTPFDTTNFVPGPKILPSTQLLKALDKGKNEAKAPLWKVPIVVTRKSDGMGGVESAFIGVDQTLPEADRIYVKLEDGALGVSLLDRLHQYCKESESCKLWVAGYWDKPMLGAMPSEPNLHVISLRAVLGPQTERFSNAEAHVFYRKN
jgi:hypothetical protein